MRRVDAYNLCPQLLFEKLLFLMQRTELVDLLLILAAHLQVLILG